MLTIPVGNTHRQEPVAPVRTEPQRAVVQSIVESDEFDFACGNPLDSEVGAYRGPFVFWYYNHDGELQAVRVTPTGKTRRYG